MSMRLTIRGPKLSSQQKWIKMINKIIPSPLNLSEPCSIHQSCYCQIQIHKLAKGTNAIPGKMTLCIMNIHSLPFFCITAEVKNHIHLSLQNPQVKPWKLLISTVFVFHNSVLFLCHIFHVHTLQIIYSSKTSCH